MKKIFTFVAVLILVNIALSSIRPIILLGIAAAIAYYCFKSFVKSPSLLGKFGWGILGIVGFSTFFNAIPGHAIRHMHMHHSLLMMFSNVISALMGIAAIAFLYYGYKHWKKEKAHTAPSSDPEYADFKNFEREWEDIMNKHK